MTASIPCSNRLSAEIGIPVAVRTSRGSSGITVRMDMATGGARVTAAHGMHPDRICGFVLRHADRLRAEAARLPPRSYLGPGGTLRIFGVERRIVAVNGHGARLDDGCGDTAIRVDLNTPPGPQVLNFVQALARVRFAEIATRKAAAIGRAMASLEIEDVRGRWGLCDRKGAVSISWRIAMAPIEVADYVVAHEVAHLAQMNHGPRFWQVCGSISASPPDLSIAWLKANGQRLRRCL